MNKDQHADEQQSAVIKQEPSSNLRNKTQSSSNMTVTTSKHAKKPSQGVNKPKAPTTFVLKMWSMMNDKSNSQYIKWTDDGKSFQVVHRDEFARIVLPKYFKHVNFSSFVRQLNMYGFHKVQDVTSGALQGPEEIWQFKSPFFQKSREDLLDNIQRKSVSKEDSEQDVEIDRERLFNELEMIRKAQLSIGQELQRMKEDNQLLWQKSIQSQQRHQEHSETLQKIMKFLASVYGPNAAGRLEDATMPPKYTQQRRILMPNPDNVSNSRISSISNESPANSQSLNDVFNLDQPSVGIPVSSNNIGLTEAVGEQIDSPKASSVSELNPGSGTTTSIQNSASASSPGLQNLVSKVVPTSSNGITVPPTEVMPSSGAVNSPNLAIDSSLTPGTLSQLYPIGPVGSGGIGDEPYPQDNLQPLIDHSRMLDELTRKQDEQDHAFKQVQNWINDLDAVHASPPSESAGTLTPDNQSADFGLDNYNPSDFLSYDPVSLNDENVTPEDDEHTAKKRKF